MVCNKQLLFFKGQGLHKRHPRYFVVCISALDVGSFFFVICSGYSSS